MAKVELKIRCFNLPAVDFFSKSDPLVTVYAKVEGEEDKWEKLGATECIPNHLAPVFVTPVVVNWDEKAHLKFEVVDMDDNKLDDVSRAQYIGHYIVSLAELVCIGGATGRKRLHWKNGKMLTNGSISVLATVLGEDVAAIKSKALAFVEAETQRAACTLYWSPFVPASLACLAVAKTELSKEVKLQQVGKDNKLDINAAGTLPFLDDAGFRLNGAITILRYLLAKYPHAGTNLLPSEFQAAARVNEHLEWHSANIGRGAPFLAAQLGLSVPQAAQDEGKGWYDSGLDHIEGLLGKSTFIAGDAITLADVISFMNIALLPASFTETRPNVTRWIKGMAAYAPVVAEAKQAIQ